MHVGDQMRRVFVATGRSDALYIRSRLSCAFGCSEPRDHTAYKSASLMKANLWRVAPASSLSIRVKLLNPHVSQRLYCRQVPGPSESRSLFQQGKQSSPILTNHLCQILMLLPSCWEPIIAALEWHTAHTTPSGYELAPNQRELLSSTFKAWRKVSATHSRRLSVSMAANTCVESVRCRP